MKRLLPLPLLLAACGQRLAPPMPPASGPKADLDTYRAAAASGAAIYAVDPGASLLTVTVRRADVSFRADQMTVDEPHLLREAGIDTQPSPEAVEGTRKNMLGPVLEAQRYPVVALHAERLAGGRLRVAVTLHGGTRWLELPATVQVDAAQVTADGTARLKQTDFGITAFSVGGGLLSVQDELEVRYHIVARR
jgi:polyisoprenoid-binding protein YceI